MKKIFSWGLYFIVCAIVIVTAIMAGRNHEHCRECDFAFREISEKSRYADQWMYLGKPQN